MTADRIETAEGLAVTREQVSALHDEADAPNFEENDYAAGWHHAIGALEALFPAEDPTLPPEPRMVFVDEREESCTDAWPGCASGEYDPRCCRFPKSCSVRGRYGLVPTPFLAVPDPEVERMRAGIEVLDSDLDRGRASGRIYTYGQIQFRLRALLGSST